MINRTELLTDLQNLLKSIEGDLISRSDSDDLPEVRDWLQAEYKKAKEAERTAFNFEDWRTDYVTQVAAAWILSCVFVRFLEDNQLIDPPRISGPDQRLQRARDERDLFFKNSPTDTDREYLLSVFSELAELPGGDDLFGPHNILNELPNWISGDAAGELLSFFQKVEPDTGELVHDFTDDDWNTRFLGDLYQDLSEKARKKYALLQTPDFVEEFILDRTLEPALDEFGLTPDTNPEKQFKMIDPACGSGHFLLGAFPRILERWQKKEPGTKIRELVQRTLGSIHGVDINPFAIAIARFRLLLAALAASGVRRLADAPAFSMNLACGDSLYHGVDDATKRQQVIGDWTDESHYFRTEDAENLRRILQEETFHAVVANPPYIVPKDKAANAAYRRLYQSCSGKYSLSVPFMERVLRLAARANGTPAGYTGQITSNSFMKREFGNCLIEEFLPTVDVTHVIDTSGAYLPGHGTPTLILFARNRDPINNTVRAVQGISGEPEIPKIPSQGRVWKAIVEIIDTPGCSGTFVGSADVARTIFNQHPWTLGGGGISELRGLIENRNDLRLSQIAETAIGVVTGEDDVFVAEKKNWRRRKVSACDTIQFIEGDRLREWMLDHPASAVFPHDRMTCEPKLVPEIQRVLWSHRTGLCNRIWFGKTQIERGMKWFEYSLISKSVFGSTEVLAYGEVATHNHFVHVTSHRDCVFKQTAPVIMQPPDHRQFSANYISAVLNSSIVGFWLMQVCMRKGGSRSKDGARLKTEMWTNQMQFNSTKVGETPLPKEFCENVDRYGKEINEYSRVLRGLFSDLKDANSLSVQLLSSTVTESRKCQSHMIRLQEELDWECYRLYGLIEDHLTYEAVSDQLLVVSEDNEEQTDNQKLKTNNSFGIQLGERAFEIVMARKMATGELTTTWFDRHGSTPITEIPSHWPDDYKQLVQRRIETIESNSQIALIEQPEYKRRWNTEPWDSQVERAIKSWLLDRLESYFDFDRRMKEDLTQSREDAKEEGPENLSASAPLHEISLYSISQLANTAGSDPQFNEVASVYRDDPAFDVLKLVQDLVSEEHVPLLPVLRYKPAGLRKRDEWEKTWQLQRLEDEVRDGKPLSDPRVAELIKECEITTKQCEQIETWRKETPEAKWKDTTFPEARVLDRILSIPVPPKYKSSDFISTKGAKYWKLRGKLDVPKERWISFPHCDAEDGSMMICWAGYDHLQQATAIAAWYVRIKEEIGGAEDPRLIPLLAALIEILPWLKQWHNEIDPNYGMAMGDYYEGFINEEARSLPKKRTDEDGTETVSTGWTIEEIKGWQPNKK